MYIYTDLYMVLLLCMSLRKEPFVPGEFYHCYNRGVDKRVVFEDASDFSYFLDVLTLFNDTDSTESIRDRHRKDNLVTENSYVSIVAYCLNRNHYHLLVQENVDGGISKFMQKIGTGYTMYFNKKYLRSGSLFQGKFKSKHVDSDAYLKHLGIYISINNQVHGIIKSTEFRSSFKSFLEQKDTLLCKSSILLNMYDSTVDYEREVFAILPTIIREKKEKSDLLHELYHE